MSYLSLHHITKSWGGRKALDDVGFDVAEGDFVALLGPSGCGKTTLLRIIAGLESADGGSVVIRQADVTCLPPSQRKLSMVFQSYALFPHLNVRENLLFGLRARGEDKRHFPSRLAEVSELLELTPLLDRLPGQLSGGQQQRVALGRAVIAKNRLCLMDEPLSNLDAKLRQTMRREIRALQKTLGLTLLYVTHDQTEAMSMADQVILLNQGRIEQHCAPDRLYQDPGSVFAAQFIGAPPMNILSLTRKGSHHFIGDMPAPVAEYGDETVLGLGLRAEDIRLAAPEHARLTVSVVSCEYMGADTLLSCQPRGCREQITVKVPGMKRFAPTSPVGLDWSAAAQYFFFGATGKRCYGAEQSALPLGKKFAV
ncbi:ABC transporter ATP-binding protein [Martelella alba]|uniref:ABC transporter ATP-binding protein n=1 Tax=Martelella alba TaxID=2590451 RepID=A0ABY2SRT7_9HYPH|nr:ABC transporter ATP-binding protein [Martelella alba]TKI08135.1 ABC transporter ATP-binding protein [Martelella alba]